jgi:hypothetical protein
MAPNFLGLVPVIIMPTLANRHLKDMMELVAFKDFKTKIPQSKHLFILQSFVVH